MFDIFGKYKNGLTPFYSEIYNIDKDKFVIVESFDNEDYEYTDIVLNYNNDNIFLGRFIAELTPMRIKYSNNKILMYSGNYNIKTSDMNINKIYGLYDLTDDMFLYDTEENILSLFDNKLDKSNLITPDEYITSSGVEKKKRLVK